MVKQKTVRMRLDHIGFGRPMCWWKAWLGGRWMFAADVMCTSDRGARRSGNAWAKRMGLAPKWE